MIDQVASALTYAHEQGVIHREDAMQSSNTLEQHQWLRQLVGEWSVSGALMEPDGASVVWDSRESIRAIGDFWIVAEGTADGDGQPYVSLMTLGYDPNKEAFVGSWIDTMLTTMWSFVGQLDESGRVLTFESEGPSFADPSATTRYREQIEIVSSEVKRTTSSALGEDGSWTTFMTREARREK